MYTFALKGPFVKFLHWRKVIRTINKDIIANRINEYNNKTAPLKEFYSSQDKLSEVEGIGSVEDIAQKLNSVIDKL